MGNEVLSVFSSNNFFSENNIFQEKKNFRRYDHFLGGGVILRQNECNLFYHKLGAKYFYAKQFFQKKQYFQEGRQKTVLGAHLIFFREMGRFTQKINVA